MNADGLPIAIYYIIIRLMGSELDAVWHVDGQTWLVVYMENIYGKY